MDYSTADSSFAPDMSGTATFQSDGGAPATINMDKLRRIQASIPVQDPSAPLGSNKNPIRIIQQGNRFITTQNLSDEQLSQITQVLHNQSILNEVQKSSTGGTVVSSSGPIVSHAAGTPIGMAGGRVLSPASKSLFRDLDNTSSGLSPAKRRRGKRSPEEEDPDFDPIAEEEGRKPGRYLYPDDSIIFQCERCDLQFMSRQALLKHVQLRHEQRDARRVQYVPVRKRSALKAALKTSTDEELVDICLPRLAKLANPFDFMLVKSERGDPPLPNLAMLVDDLVNLVDISRKFLKDHLVRLPQSDQRPVGSVCVDTQAKADILGVEVGNYGVRAVLNEGYLPPRHRVSMQAAARRGPAPTQHQQLEFHSGVVAARYLTTPVVDSDTVIVSSAGHSGLADNATATSGSGFDINMKIGPKSTQLRQLQQPPHHQQMQQQQQRQQPVITDKDIAVERYYQVLDENGQPSEFVIEVATGQFFNRITGEQVAVMQEGAEAEGADAEGAAATADEDAAASVAPASTTMTSPPMASEQQQLQQEGEEATVAVEAAAGKNGPSSAVDDDSAAAASGDNGADAQAASASAAGEAPVAEAEGGSGGGGDLQQAGAVAADTGEPVQIDLSAMFPGVSLQDLDDNVLLITKPDGSTLQVEHGGQGITLEFLQELLNTQFD